MFIVAQRNPAPNSREPEVRPANPPRDFGHYFSTAAKRRRPTNFTMFYNYYGMPNLLDVSGGFPHPSMFPLTSLSAGLKDADAIGEGGCGTHIKAEGPLLIESLQYSQAYGVKALAKWVDDFTKQRTRCLYDGGFATTITGGNSDGWTKVLATFTEEWRDSDDISTRGGVLVEKFSFAISTEAARVRGLNVVPIQVDSLGLCPEALEEALANWDYTLGKRPSMLYTISHGQNPTGAVATPARRAAIYEICCRYDVLIVADEPYLFLQFDSPCEDTYLAHDTQGRVIQLDSFSKCFAPGMRLGWVTGQPALVKAVYSLIEEATQPPAGPSQAVLLQSLNEWGVEGWKLHLRALSNEYQARRDLLCDALGKYAYDNGSQLLTWTTPQSGMFLWVRVEWQNHPEFGLGAEKLSKALWVHHTQAAIPALVCPGSIFTPNIELDIVGERHWRFRLTFAATSREMITSAADAIGASVVDFWKLNKKSIDELATYYPE